MNNDETQ